MTQKSITIKDNGIKKEFVITKLFASDSLKFANMLTTVLQDDEDNIKFTKSFLNVIIKNGEIPESAVKENPSLLEFDYIEMILQLVQRRYLIDDSFMEILLNNTAFINGTMKIANLSLIKNKGEANNINSIIETIPGIYALINEHLILNYQDFFLASVKHSANIKPE